MVVQHNLQAMNANRMLGITSSQTSSSTEKLSSGYKINRAADDAAGLAISEKMRKQIRGLDQASENSEDGISCVQTAEGALAEVQDMLQRMNELCVQAANGTNSKTDRQYIQDEIDELVTEIDRVSETTKFNEIYLLKGDAETNGYYNMYVINYITQQTPNEEHETNEDLPAGKWNYIGNNNVYIVSASISSATSIYSQMTADTISKGDDITGYLTGGTTMGTTPTGVNTTSYAAFTRTTYDADSDATLESTTSKYKANGTYYLYNNDESKVIKVSNGDDVTEFLDDSGNLLSTYTKLQTYTMDTDTELEEDMSYAPLYDADGNEVSEMKLRDYFNDQGNYKGGLFKSSNATTDDTVESNTEGNTTFTDTEIGYYVTANVERVANSLSFDLQAGSDSDRSNKITTEIQTLSAAGIGINRLASNRIGIVDETGDLATDAIDVVTEALQIVSTQRSALGAVQNRLEHTIKNLDNVVENTTAAESQIRDTDMAEEMVTYSNANILLQAGQSMLAQANQSNQGVLTLLQ